MPLPRPTPGLRVNQNNESDRGPTHVGPDLAAGGAERGDEPRVVVAAGHAVGAVLLQGEEDEEEGVDGGGAVAVAAERHCAEGEGWGGRVINKR